MIVLSTYIGNNRKGAIDSAPMKVSPLELAMHKSGDEEHSRA